MKSPRRRHRLVTGSLCTLLLLGGLGGYAYLSAQSTPTSSKSDQNQGKVLIDTAINTQLDQLGLSPARLCDDASFHRRVSLILTGRLPSWQEAEAFIANPDKEKRAKLIDKLMASEAFIDFQVLKWGDLLRIKAEFPSNIWPNGVQAYARWVREQMRANRPHDEMVYELLTSTGSNFRSPAVNFYRAFQKREPQIIADNVALLFLATPKAPAAMASFFTQLRYKATREWKEEIVYIDLDAPLKQKKASMPDGTVLTLEAGRDQRRTLARWIVGERGKRVNRAFARAMVNRVWFWIMGQGIVTPVDDINPKNKPVNPQLLNQLEKEFVASHYDVQGLMKKILLSDAFARDSRYEGSAEQKARALQHFAYYPTQRLTAEQIVDALGDITGIFDTYTSKVPEPYSYYPSDIRSVQLEDGSVGSPQLELFGRPSRDVSLESDRSNLINTKQVLYLLNSAAVLEKLAESEQLARFAKEAGERPELIRRIYLMMLGREPKGKELKMLTKKLSSQADVHKAAQLLIWALFNSPEFLFNH